MIIHKLTEDISSNSSKICQLMEYSRNNPDCMIIHRLTHLSITTHLLSYSGAIVDPIENVRKVVRRMTTYDSVEKGITEYNNSLIGIPLHILLY